jgi:hypothetical protein
MLFTNALLVLTAICGLSGSPARAEVSPTVPDWSASAEISPWGRPNPYGWDEKTLAEKIRVGRLHALNYPVDTGLMLPAKAALSLLDAKPGSALFNFVKTVLSLRSDFQDFNGFWDWLGLSNYPDTETDIPFPNGVRPKYPMGVSLIRKISTLPSGHGFTEKATEGFTMGCAACHTSQLFGKAVFGMTTRFPRANAFFLEGKHALHQVSPELFATFVKLTPDEKEMYRDARDRIRFVGLKKPGTLGLDTSLAQVALSLANRAPTEWAERTEKDLAHPRPNLLNEMAADSKPSVWWNLKYKTRWLSDGSVISGNPVFTNFLWNEIGRGADLPALADYLARNSSMVEELTTAVFATKAPKWKDFLSESAVQVERAKHGEILFSQNCASCHGDYQKAWNLKPLEFAAYKLKHPEGSVQDTLQVSYFPQTRAVNVGTDLNRRIGMQALADGLNPLAFSKRNQMVIEVQKGYVPPPLEGIWARYPYLHNNSIPNLCALMTPPSQRPVIYYAGKAIDPDRDYDQNCVGYPLKNVPAAWKQNSELLFDTRKSGQGNSGHYEGIFTDAQGAEVYSRSDKQDLIEFLKTL